MMDVTPPIVQFELPPPLASPLPTEERNIPRDAVRLLITNNTGSARQAVFHQLDQYLEAGDVLIVNTSATVPSALPVTLPDRRGGQVHLSQQINGREWLVEVREIHCNRTQRWREGEKGMSLLLPGNSQLLLKHRYYRHRQWLDLWVAELRTSEPVSTYLAAQAYPIQYEGLEHRYPLEYYQTYFSFHPGSAEMPSAGRGFTPQLVERLLKKGILFAPVLLHTGVSSLEENEKPYPEYAEVSPVSAAIINTAREQGRRIVAVGTTAVRAVESATHGGGEVVPYRGSTNLYIDADYRINVVNGLLTGFHEPRASHLHMLQAIAGYEHLRRAYQVALDEGYYWHQFGDLHLILS